MSPSTSGRALYIVLALAALAAVAVLFLVADPLGGGDAIDRDESAADAGDLRTEGESADGPGALREAGSLVGRYGEGDLGAVRLRLLDVGSREPMADQPVALVGRQGGKLETASGADGVVLFGRVGPSRGYRLEIGGEGHVALTVQGVVVRSGETNDLGDFFLGENVVLRGRVLDGSGRPIPGSSVGVYSFEQSVISEGFVFSMVRQATRFPAALETAETDEEGWFTLTSLKPGIYRLEARHAGYATRFESDVMVSKERPARDMTIVLGEAATVSGKVLDDTGRPVPDARIVAIRDSGGRMMGMGRGVLERDVGTSDGYGVYTLDTLTQGTTYRFGVVAEGFAPLFEMQAVTIDQKRMEKDFQIVLGGAISGRVTSKTDGSYVEGAQVVVAVGRMAGPPRRGATREEQRMGTGMAETGEDGRFRIEALMPGPVMSAQVKAPGYVSYGASMFTGNPWAPVVAGEVSEVTVELVAGGTVTGTITDKTSGQPVMGANVSVIPRQNPWQVMFSGSPSATSGADGTYTIAGVPAGKYGVVASGSGYAATSASDEALTVEVTEVGGVSTLNVQLERAGVVTGIVTDSQGEPIAGARVRTRAAPAASGGEGGGRRGRRGGRFAAMLPGGSGADLTDQDGLYVIEDVASDRRWIVEASAEDFVGGESEAFSVGAGETKEVGLALSGGGDLEGHVVDDRGLPVEGARVRVGHVPSDSVGRRLNAWQADRYLDQRVFFTDSDGRFKAPNLQPGRTMVKVEHEGFVSFYKRNLMLTADETYSNYTVALTRGDILKGRVLGATGQPVRGAFVGLSTRENPMADEPVDEGDETIEPGLAGQTDEEGRFTIEDVPPGHYNALVWFAPGHKSWRRGQSEKAIRRGVASSATDVEFRLDAEDGDTGFGPGRGGR